jgi:hypothetical protein
MGASFQYKFYFLELRDKKINRNFHIKNVQHEAGLVDFLAVPGHNIIHSVGNPALRMAAGFSEPLQGTKFLNDTAPELAEIESHAHGITPPFY